jgi:hypothetical protein
MKSSFKIIIIVLAVGALGGGAYFALGNRAQGQTEDEPLLQSNVTNKAVNIPQGTTATDATVQAVLRQISDLDSIKLNTDIFDKPEFLALKDISQELPQPTDIGRPNPFAPIGIDVGLVPLDGGQPAGSTAGLPGADLAITSSTIKTNEVQNIGQRSVTLSASTTLTATTNRWFEWGTNQNTINKTTKQSGTEANFTATLTSLSPGTIYYVKAAVEDGGATTYGELVLFKTAE